MERAATFAVMLLLFCSVIYRKTDREDRIRTRIVLESWNMIVGIRVSDEARMMAKIVQGGGKVKQFKP